MHILQLGPYPPPQGGINRNMLAIRDELLKNGYRCSIIATSKSTKITNEPDVYHPRTPFSFIKLLFSLKYDILHLHVGGDVSRRVLALIFVCGLFRRGRNVLSFHSGGYSQTDEAKAAKKNSVSGFLFRRFERIIVVNPLLAGIFGQYGVSIDKICVIYPFVHKLPDPNVQIPDELNNFVSKHSPLLLTVGLLEKEYDLFMQIDSLGEVLRTHPNAGLLIVGSGSLEAKLKDAITAKPYAASLHLAGDVENQITLHLIDKADMLLRTTLFDGDAISIREALFLGTPVIATDNNMRPDGVHLIPVGDKNKLIEQIGKLADHKKKDIAVRKEDKSNIDAVITLYLEVSNNTAT